MASLTHASTDFVRAVAAILAKDGIDLWAYEDDDGVVYALLEAEDDGWSHQRAAKKVDAAIDDADLDEDDEDDDDDW